MANIYEELKQYEIMAKDGMGIISCSCMCLIDGQIETTGWIYFERENKYPVRVQQYWNNEKNSLEYLAEEVPWIGY